MRLILEDLEGGKGGEKLCDYIITSKYERINFFKSSNQGPYLKKKKNKTSKVR